MIGRLLFSFVKRITDQWSDSPTLTVNSQLGNLNTQFVCTNMLNFLRDHKEKKEQQVREQALKRALAEKLVLYEQLQARKSETFKDSDITTIDINGSAMRVKKQQINLSSV